MWLVAVLVCLGWIVSLCLHEFGHAIVAYWGGDKSVKDKGYLTLNPLKYTDPGLSLMLPLFFLIIGGIALPGGAVYIDHSRLSRPWKSAVSAAGPFANIIVILLFTWLFQLTQNHLETGNTIILVSLAFLILLNIYVVFINLLPLPPLDGYGIIQPWLPPQIQQQLNKVGKYGIWVLIGLLWFARPFNQLLWNWTHKISDILGIPSALAGRGSAIFSQHSQYLVLGLIIILWLFRDKNRELLGRGKQLLTNHKYQPALIAFDKLIKNQPNHPEAWYWRGHTLYHLQQYNEAIFAYDKALKLAPELTNALYNQACCYALQGDDIQAISTLQQAINLDPERFRQMAKTDPDFNCLREHPSFQVLIEP